MIAFRPIRFVTSSSSELEPRSTNLQSIHGAQRQASKERWTNESSLARSLFHLSREKATSMCFLSLLASAPNASLDLPPNTLSTRLDEDIRGRKVLSLVLLVSLSLYSCFPFSFSFLSFSFPTSTSTSTSSPPPSSLVVGVQVPTGSRMGQR